MITLIRKYTLQFNVVDGISLFLSVCNVHNILINSYILYVRVNPSYEYVYSQT